MRFTAVLGGMAGVLMMIVPALAQQAGNSPDGQPAPPATVSSPAMGWREQAVPLLAQIIRQKSQLGLSAAQLETIERLSRDFAREAIRRQAEWQMAMIDLAVMLEPDPADPTRPLDLPRLEAKIREVSVIGGEIEMMRLRTIETGKAQLRPEQRIKLVGLLDGDDPPDAPAIRPTSAPHGGGGFPAHPGGGGPGRPPGPPGHFPGPPGHFPGHPPGIHGGVPGRGYVGVWPGWPWYWWGWGYPGPIYAPPPAPAYWYYCPAYGDYYPNVPSCPEPWVPVPAG